MEEQISISNPMKSDHPYFNLFKDKTKNLQKLFVSFNQQNCYKGSLPQFSFKAFCEPSALQGINAFRYFFTFPINLQTYLSVMQDQELQKKCDMNIDEYFIAKKMKEVQTQLVYISYKKIIIVMPRDFYYVKHSFKIGNQHWIISSSDLSYDQIKGRTRGQVIFSATRIIEKQNNQIDVSVFSQVDMKMKIKFQTSMNKGFAGIIKYLENVLKACQNH